jgi:hypothetical protein
MDISLLNNILAPFWTDLNPSLGGRILINVLKNATTNNLWTVVEWQNVVNHEDQLPNTFQVWIGSKDNSKPDEDIFFTYGTKISKGDGGFLTIGAEDKYGSYGATVHFDGIGTLNNFSEEIQLHPNDTIQVLSQPGEPGEIHTITFTLKAKRTGLWTNCAEMTSNLFQGTHIACDQGEVGIP